MLFRPYFRTKKSRKKSWPKKEKTGNRDRQHSEKEDGVDASRSHRQESAESVQTAVQTLWVSASGFGADREGLPRAVVGIIFLVGEDLDLRNTIPIHQQTRSDSIVCHPIKQTPRSHQSTDGIKWTICSSSPINFLLSQQSLSHQSCMLRSIIPAPPLFRSHTTGSVSDQFLNSKKNRQRHQSRFLLKNVGSRV
eukprot:1985290-Rhodomonas_salina.1